MIDGEKYLGVTYQKLRGARLFKRHPQLTGEVKTWGEATSPEKAKIDWKFDLGEIVTINHVKYEVYRRQRGNSYLRKINE